MPCWFWTYVYFSSRCPGSACSGDRRPNFLPWRPKGNNCKSKIEKTKVTLLSQTLKVEENKVPLILPMFAQGLRYCLFSFSVNNIIKVPSLKLENVYILASEPKLIKPRQIERSVFFLQRTTTWAYRLIWGQLEDRFWRNCDFLTEDDDLEKCILKLYWTATIEPANQKNILVYILDILLL